MSATSPDPIERRFIGEIRMDPGGDRKLVGHAVVFNRKSVVLIEKNQRFREIIRPEAVDRTLQHALDVRALIDHDPTKVLGRTRAGTLRLQVDGVGLQVNITPPNTMAARDLLESVSRGDVSGMSFAFKTIRDDWSIEDGEVVREVLDMEIREVSVVSFPAYLEADVHMAQRSLEVFQATQRGSRIDWLRKVHKTRLAG